MLTSLAFATLAFASVAKAAEGAKWDHNDIEAWNKLGDCAAPDNLYQSPLNFNSTDSYPASDVNLEIFYPDTVNAAVSNNGHGSPQLNFETGSAYVEVDGERYNLLQVHFHAPSEEEINGVAPDFDAHFVHQNPDNKALLVIGVLFNEGTKGLPLLETAVNADPVDPSAEPKDVTGVPLASVVPDSDFYTFQGSLTTPPCSGGLKWFVATEPQTATAAQIAALKAVGVSQGLESGNARPVQPLNGREVSLTKATRSAPAVMAAETAETAATGTSAATTIAAGIATMASAVAMFL